MKSVHNIFTQNELQEILALAEVIEAYEKLSRQKTVYFSIPATDSIKQKLADAFQLDIFNLSKIPCRWISGDTPSHTDRGQNEFENTYLVYLTDGEGEFHLGEEIYPIVAGTGYSFSEGLSHEVTGTNGSSRLLLGPMSEQGFAVGGINIEADGATEIVYLRDNAGTVQYRINAGAWINVPFACYVGNSNPDRANNILKFIYTTDITLTDWNQNFICATDGIQFGSESLNPDGSRPTITVSNAPNFRGIIINGTSSGLGGQARNHIYIYNLNVIATGTSTLDDGTYLGYAGWIGGSYYGNRASNNYIVNCSSSGPINDSQGGIVGAYAGSGSGGSLIIRGCSSSGNMTQLSGGIAGAYAGQNGSITCDQCFATGAIGSFAGGIFGDYAGDGGSATATKSYTTNSIGGNGGGIFGRYAGNNGTALASKCYSQGAIDTDAGGIFGLGAASGTGIASAQNCYSKGSITTTGNGIFGTGRRVAGSTTSTCYTANNNWSEASANSNLTGVPLSSDVGTTWVKVGTNQPYELNGIGYSPYLLTIINASSELIQAFSQSITVGSSSSSAIVSGKSYLILDKSGGTSDSYSTITINSSSGVITTTAATIAGTYTITIRNTGSYNITTFNLTITDPISSVDASVLTTPSCCVTGPAVKGISYEWINQYRTGNALVSERAQNSQLRFVDYSEYVKYIMTRGSRKV